jgi:hypothetical protein
MVGNRARELIGAAALLAAAGCRDAPRAGRTETIIDISVPRDAGAPDAPSDAGRAPDAAACPRPVDPAAPCPPAVADCRPTWAEVVANPICKPVAPAGQGGRESRGACGGYDISWVTYTGGSVAFYYDHLTGGLAAIYGLTLPKLTLSCTAGPPAGVGSACLQSVSLTAACPADAGADARD